MKKKNYMQRFLTCSDIENQCDMVSAFTTDYFHFKRREKERKEKESTW